MSGVCTANRGYLLKYCYDAGVVLLNCTQARDFQPNGVTARQNQSKTVPDPYLSWTPQLPENVVNPLAPKIREEYADVFLPADAIVLAVGGRPREGLFHRLQQAFPDVPVDNIGDSFAAGMVHGATRSGYAAGVKD